jgi:hypothetical protein
MERLVKRYDIIYADPPWQFKVWGEGGNDRRYCHCNEHVGWVVFGDQVPFSIRLPPKMKNK